MKYIIILFYSILLLSSCNSVKLTTIEVKKPASLTFPTNVANIIIVDNTPTDNSSYTDAKEGETSIITLDSARSITLTRLQQFMTEEGYFNNVELYPYRTNESSTNIPQALSRRKIQSICYEKNANALISLDLFTASGELDTEAIGYMSSYRLIGAKLGALIKVYSEEGELYSEPIVLLDSLYREEVVNWSKVNSDIPPLNELITELAILTADHLTGKFIPSWQQQERWFYSNNSSAMKKAAKLAENNNWKDAVEIWISLYNKEKNIKKQTRLASNIALAYEYLDEIDKSVAWIRIAFDLLPPKSRSDLALEVATYKTFLEKRLSAIPLLHKQLGISKESTENENPTE